MFNKITKILISCFIVLSVFMVNGNKAIAKETEYDKKSIISQETIDLFKNSYDSLTGRITERGYTPTSLTGTYVGMFPRDSSIQALMYTQFGDLENAKKILNFLLSYNQGLGLDYMGHILDNYQDESYGNYYLGNRPANSNEIYYSQPTNKRLLFMIKHGTNKAAQPFSVPFKKIEKVRLQLNNKNDGDKVTVRIMTDYKNDSTEIARQEIILNGSQSDGSCIWREVSFDDPVNVYSNSRYYLVVEQPDENGYIAWGGIDAEGSFQAINYDNGWSGSGSKNITSFEIIGSENVEKTSYYSAQTNASNQLFKVNATNNAAAQPFAVGYENITGVRVYLEKTNNSDEVTVKLMEDYRDDSTTVASKKYIFGDNPSGWQTIKFDDNVVLDVNKTYYLYIQGSENSGKVIWNGVRTSNNYGAKNYDKNTYNGWKDEECTTAFEILYNTDLNKKTIAQKHISTNKGVFKGVYTTLNAEKPNVKVNVELKASLDGDTIATAQLNTKTGKNQYYCPFTKEIAIDKDDTFYIVMKTENSNEKINWIPNGSINNIDEKSYFLENGVWNENELSLSLKPVISTQGILMLGGDHKATQEIKTLDSETITAVEIDIEKTEKANGVLIGTLYKKTDSGLLFVDQNKVDISDKQLVDKVKFLFGLPLKKIEDKSSNYVLEITSQGIEENEVKWLGSPETDILDTAQDGVTVVGEASYEAFKSNIRTHSNAQQVDGNYSVILSWARWVETAKKDPEYETKYKAWVEESYPVVANLANYYLKDTNDFKTNGFYTEWNLIFNPSIEHTRQENYHEGYDLMTNVFISQALHELKEIGDEFNDFENTDKWKEYDEKIVKGINEHLIIEVNGKEVYKEMHGAQIGDKNNYKDIIGYSWINISPLAVNWHGMNESIMKNTYEEYQRLGTVNIDSAGDFNNYKVLDSCVFVTDDGMELNRNSGLNDGHWDSGFTGYVIGKGWSWELIYNNEILKDETRVNELIDFQLKHLTSENLYIEFWWWNDYRGEKHRYTDPGNQEHASWQAYAVCTVFPTMRKSYGIHLDDYNEMIKKINSLNSNIYTEESWNNLQKKIDESKTILTEDDLLQAEVNLQLSTIEDAYEKLEKRVADKTELENVIKHISTLSGDTYTVSSWKALKDLIFEAETIYKDETVSQNTVDEMTDRLLTAISNLKDKADYSILEEKIKEAEKIDVNKYTDESIQAFNIALERAKIVAENGDASQREVDSATDELENATKGLIKVATVNEPTNQEITSDKAAETGDNSNLAVYASILTASAFVILFVLKKKLL